MSCDGVSQKVQQLIDKLGFDPAKQPTGDAGVLSKVLTKIKQERDAKVEAQVEDLLRKLIDLREKMAKAKKDFDREFQKSEKELGKLLGELERLASGKPAGEEPAEGDGPAPAQQVNE